MALARPPGSNPPPSWWGWGDPAQVPTLSEEISKLLADGLGVRGAPGHPEDVGLPPSRLEPEGIEALARVIGREHAARDHGSRLRHLRGKSTLDLLRLRVGDARGAPDAVLFPGSHEEVSELLQVCSERRIAVVPFGGGTSVVGGLEPEPDGFAAVVAVDLSRMNALLELDPESLLAVFEPGLRGPPAEALLSERGYTLGHFPQSFEYATLGGFAATRSSGQASAGYGRFDEMVLGLRAATPAGTIELGRAPRSATGPDLRQLLLGSEGAFGVITSLTLQVHPAPERRVHDGWRLPSFSAGLAAVRTLAQAGTLPSVLRLSDEAETALGLASPGALGSGGDGCLAIVGYDGSLGEVELRRAAAGRVLEAVGAEPELGAGRAWERDRYRAPYLRDALLDAGALVETVETAAFWSALPQLYDAVREALREALAAQGTPPVVLCHVSHVYTAGASLYFTVACAQAENPVSQWRQAKAAASDAILESGGSISHHHGVGIDHRRWYEREVGPLGIAALRAVKSALDPAGIMNPGILIPPR